MNFKEFLVYNEAKGVLWGTRTKRHERVLRVKDLGEWAWKELAMLIKKKLYGISVKGIEQVAKQEVMLFDIAFACLGKAEVKKRLKERVLIEAGTDIANT